MDEADVDASPDGAAPSAGRVPKELNVSRGSFLCPKKIRNVGCLCEVFVRSLRCVKVGSLPYSLSFFNSSAVKYFAHGTCAFMDGTWSSGRLPSVTVLVIKIRGDCGCIMMTEKNERTCQREALHGGQMYFAPPILFFGRASNASNLIIYYSRGHGRSKLPLVSRINHSLRHELFTGGTSFSFLCMWQPLTTHTF